MTTTPQAQVSDDRLKNIRLVRQKHAHGCLPACMAMVSGRTYEDVLSFFPRENPAEGGFNHYHLFDFFAYEDFACQRLNKYVWYGDTKERDVWPVKFDAEAAICMVDAGRGGEHSHGIVLLCDGRVFDPVHGEKHWSDYTRVGSIFPLWDLRALSAPPARDDVAAMVEALEDAANKMQAVVRSITDAFPEAHGTIAMLEEWSAEVRANVARAAQVRDNYLARVRDGGK